MALGMKNKPDVMSVTPPRPQEIGAMGGTVQAPAKIGAANTAMPNPTSAGMAPKVVKK